MFQKEILTTATGLSRHKIFHDTHEWNKEKFLHFWNARSQTIWLVNLLGPAIGEARAGSMYALARVLESNLADEIGMDGREPHTFWRTWFYEGIGLERKEHSNAALMYNKSIEVIIESKSLEKVVGAILLMEVLIPYTYKKLQAARNKNYPDLSKKARIYIDDHIEHDARNHYPNLLHAIENTPSLDLDEVLTGAYLLADAKRDFYNVLDSMA